MSNMTFKIRVIKSFILRPPYSYHLTTEIIQKPKAQHKSGEVQPYRLRDENSALKYTDFFLLTHEICHYVCMLSNLVVVSKVYRSLQHHKLRPTSHIRLIDHDYSNVKTLVDQQCGLHPNLFYNMKWMLKAEWKVCGWKIYMASYVANFG